jgi:ankyrin repeat protein
MRFHNSFWSLAGVLVAFITLARLVASIPNAVFEGVQNDDEDLIRDALRENPSLLNSVGVGGQTPLIHAVLTGKLTAVRTLLELGADVHAVEKDGYNVLHAAGFQGRADVLEVLLDVEGLDPMKEKHQDGFYPLHRACWGPHERHTDTVKVFLDHGVPMDLAADDGMTCAGMTQNVKTQELLASYSKKTVEL